MMMMMIWVDNLIFFLFLKHSLLMEIQDSHGWWNKKLHFLFPKMQLISRIFLAYTKHINLTFHGQIPDNVENISPTKRTLKLTLIMPSSPLLFLVSPIRWYHVFIC